MTEMQALCKALTGDQITIDMWEAQHIDEAVGEAASDRWSATVRRIAATPTTGCADLSMKAAALETVIAGLVDTEDDTVAQLALSLARDVLTQTAYPLCMRYAYGASRNRS